MNDGTMYVGQVFFLLVLCLPANAIYAEENTKNVAPHNTTTQPVAAVKKIAPEKRPEKPLEKSSGKAANVWQLHAEQWELARSGETVLSLPVLNKVIKAWLSKKDKKIEIQYPGGEDGELWVQELTDWLVSLGIPSRHMVTTPGSGIDDVIKFSIIN